MTRPHLIHLSDTDYQPRPLCRFRHILTSLVYSIAGTDLAEFCATFAQKAGLDASLERALHDRLRKELPAEEQE